MQIDDLLLPRMEDLARRAIKDGCAVSRFLSPAEAARVSEAFSRRNDVELCFDGGFAQAERQIAALTNPQWGQYMRENHIAAVQLTFRQQDSLSHRDILGAALALGLSRDVVGDIEAGNPAYIVCAADMAGFIADNLEKAGRIGLAAKIVPLSSLPQRQRNVREKRDTVASLRLDAVVAAAWDLPRGDAAEYIRAGKVSLRHRECTAVAAEVSVGDIFSLRGMGRATLLEAGGLSRKGRLRVVIGIFE